MNRYTDPAEEQLINFVFTGIRQNYFPETNPRWTFRRIGENGRPARRSEGMTLDEVCAYIDDEVATTMPTVEYASVCLGEAWVGANEAKRKKLVLAALQSLVQDGLLAEEKGRYALV